MGKSVVLFAIVLTIVLSSCVSSTNNGGIDDPISSGIEAPLIPDADNVSWTSEGGAYKQSYIDVPDDYISLFAHGSDVYFITKNFSEFETANYEIWQNYTDNIYTIEDGSIHCADISDEGIWLVESIVENESIIERLSLLSFTGDVIRTIQTRDIGIVNNSISAVLSVTDYLYIKTTDRIIVINDSGELVASHKLSALKSGLIAGNDGNAYAVQYYDDEVEVYLIQGMNISHSFTLQYPEIKLFTGNEEFCFIMSNSEGLFGVQADGSKSTIVIWKDCGLSMLGLIRVFALPNGEYYCWDIGGLSKLSPVDPSELGKRTELVLATVGQYYGILSTVSNFNQENNKYSVTIKDYSQGGTYDTNTAIMRLNTELSSGKHPDLILFSELSPYAYINNEYLLDLYQCIDNDPEITREDISILDKLEISGGVYFLSNTFNIETLVGLHSEFGDRTGWTLDEYLEFEKNSTTDREILYNNTKAKFLRQLSARYLRTAVDWEAGKCDFNNEMFIAILEASGRIKETPENQTALDFTYGPVRVVNKTLVAAASWVTNVWKLAYEEDMAGCRLSFIGWPTVDGSCGSDIYISAPVGIRSQTNSIDGSWEFVKYMLKDVELDSPTRMPVYMPYLQALVEQAMREQPSGGVQITSEDAERFFALLSEIENVAIYDEIILNIIDEEASMSFSGDKTAANTAAIIQSRVQLYISEQFS